MTQITQWYYLVPIALVFGIYQSWWRRWFGGKELPKWLRWLDKRFIKHIVNSMALFCICFFVRGLAWYWSIYATAIFQGLFWTPTFGMYFDIGRKGLPYTEKDIKEYDSQFFAPLLNWVFPVGNRYTPYYDYIGMFLRFTAPLMLVFFVPTFNSGILMLGTIVSMAYGLGWVMYEKWMLKRLEPTELAEYISGFFAGVYWVISI